MVTQLNELTSTLQKEGYLEVRLSPVWNTEGVVNTGIKLGDRYQWINLDPGNVDRNLLRQIGYREKFYSGEPFRYEELASLQHKLISRSNNLGYPFAVVNLDSVVVSSGQVSAILAFEPGPLITFDSIQISGSARVNRRFLQSYLRIPYGSPYSERLMEELPARLEQLSYLQLSESPGLTFQNDQATAYLPLQRVKSNQVDGVIGFLPNSKQDGGLLLTGQFNLQLENMFGSGRQLELQWEGYKPESQLLNISFFQPLILRSPIDVALRFNLLKEDSSFINRNFRLDLKYPYSRLHSLGLYSEFKAARLPFSQELGGGSTFPDLADFNLNQFGGSYSYTRLDRFFNPTSGFHADVSLAAGIKKIKRNSAIEDSLYQQLQTQSSQFSWEARLEKYVKATKHWVLAIKWHGGGVYNQRLFLNDLYRLGGLKSIRGFAENTYFAADFAYSSIEPRFFFETNSYLFVFYDQAWWLSYDLENNNFRDTPSGLGAGISLTTNAGIFKFVWAVGQSKIQDIGFAQSKIHFGYVSRF